MTRLPFGFAFLVAIPALAAPTRFFTLDTPASLAGSRFFGVAVRPDGGLEALPPLVPLATLAEPLAQALAVDSQGTVFVGTGHPARLYRVAEKGTELLAELSADQITSLVVAPDGALYATTALPATLVRIRGGKLETLATLTEGNFWDVAFFAGKLVLAAGNPGRLLTLTPKGLELVAEIPDRHARCLAVAGNRLLVGTSGKGLILAYDGVTLGVLYDSAFSEISSLAATPDGSVVATALTGDPTLGQKPGEGQPTVTVSTGAASGETGRFASEVLRVSPEGAVTTLARFEKDLALTTAWDTSQVLVGTALEGKLFQILDTQTLELDTVDAGQVTRIAQGGQVVLTQEPVKVLVRRGPPHGTFTSAPLDAGQPARWGRLAAVVFGPCTVSFRSGNSQEVNDTWSSWSPPAPCTETPIPAPQARFLQVKLELGPGRAQVERLQVAYRQINLPPSIKELKVYAPGEVFLKTPPPSERIVEVSHPDLSGIFTTLEDEKDTQAQLGKKYYLVGYQTVSWKVEDPNGDPVRFRVEIQRQGGPWWPVRENLESVQMAVDTQALADGLYRFRLTATDAPGNPEQPAQAQAVSSWFVVDNSPPAVSVRRDGAFWIIEAADELSPIAVAEYNRDAARWLPLAPEDGLLEGTRERFRVPVAPGTHVLSVRVIDDHHNRKVVAVEEKP
ncbi:MAG: WD40 repeat domain-containing protein [Thermoanaerobaculum sp.]